MSIRTKTLSTPEAFEIMHNDLMLERRVATPGKIVKLNMGADASLVSIDVQPLVKQVIAKESGIESEAVLHPVIRRVPLVFPRASKEGFSLTMPVHVDDNVLLIVADRAIDNWQETGSIASPVEPVTPRAHDMTDAIAILCLSDDTNAIPNYSFTKTTLRNEAGDIAVEVSNADVVLKKGAIEVTVGSDITLVNGSSSITITPAGITIDAALVTISGASLVLASTGITVSTSDLVSGDGDISLSNHIHTSGGSGNPTSPPL